jgi:pimeloyl-ACP methyl ester carboxylesterase
VLVALWREDDPKRTILRYYLMQGRGAFQFLVKAPGEYRMMAFEDLNSDMARSEKEPQGIFPQRGPLKVVPGQMITGVQIIIGDSESEDLPKIEVKSPGNGMTVGASDVKVSLDEVTNLDDPRFSPENVEIGLWEPHRFILEIGGGIFFLEPYDPNRMPVLFVHGANGSPRDWRYILEHVDRKRIQPWVAYYPSGMSLDFANQIFYRMLTELHLKYGFKQIGIAAHSMGGLLSKGFINELVSRNSPIVIPDYVTLSTPWNGHEAAEMGVKQAPTVVPSWWDVIPGSPYIKKLWQTPLPPQTRYYLLFGFSGKQNLMMNRNNDGVVTIASELYHSAQESSTGIRGFDEDHNSILTCKDVVDYLNNNVFR